MVFFSMSSTIFWIHLQAVVYPKSCYNEHYYKEVVVYIPVPVPYHYAMQMSLSTKKKKLSIVYKSSSSDFNRVVRVQMKGSTFAHNDNPYTLYPCTQLEWQGHRNCTI